MSNISIVLHALFVLCVAIVAASFIADYYREKKNGENPSIKHLLSQISKILLPCFALLLAEAYILAVGKFEVNATIIAATVGVVALLTRKRLISCN